MSSDPVLTSDLYCIHCSDTIMIYFNIMIAVVIKYDVSVRWGTSFRCLDMYGMQLRMKNYNKPWRVYLNVALMQSASDNQDNIVNHVAIGTIVHELAKLLISLQAEEHILTHHTHYLFLPWNGRIFTSCNFTPPHMRRDAVHECGLILQNKSIIWRICST